MVYPTYAIRLKIFDFATLIKATSSHGKLPDRAEIILDSIFLICYNYAVSRKD